MNNKSALILVILVVSLSLIAILVILIVKSAGKRRPLLLSKNDVAKYLTATVRKLSNPGELSVKFDKSERIVRDNEFGFGYSYRLYRDYTGSRGGLHHDFIRKEMSEITTKRLSNPRWPAQSAPMLSDACQRMKVYPAKAFSVFRSENPIDTESDGLELKKEKIEKLSQKTIMKPFRAVLGKRLGRIEEDLTTVRSNSALIESMKAENAKRMAWLSGEKEREKASALDGGETHSLSEFFGMAPESERIRGIYVLSDSKTGKKYVGQSRDIRKRVTRQHFSKVDGMIVCNNDDFKNDFDRDGIENWSVTIIRSGDDLNSLERKMIEKLDTANAGYNKTIGNID